MLTPQCNISRKTGWSCTPTVGFRDEFGRYKNTLRRTPRSPIEALKAHPIALGVVAALALSAIVNRYLAKKAERANPPAGQFITVNGVRLHYFERGTGTPLVLLHGNGTMIEDFRCSGLIDLAAKKYRVIAFDRPGFGHSERPRSTMWTPAAQADLFAVALEQIGVPRAIVFGHSLGNIGGPGSCHEISAGGSGP